MTMHTVNISNFINKSNVIIFADKNLEKAIKSELNLAGETPITDEIILNLTKLDAQQKQMLPKTRTAAQAGRCPSA